MNVIQLKREIREGVTYLMEGVTITMKRRKWARGYCPPFSYIKVAILPLSYTLDPPSFPTLLLHQLGERLAKRC
jgi:hypothetical protein